VLGLLAIVLLLSGVWLWFFYRPAVPAAWNPELGEMQPMRIVHRLASTGAMWATAVLGALLVVRRWQRWPVALAMVMIAVAGAFSGDLVAWDQLALYAVTVGEEFRGLQAVFDDGVKFVLLDGTEIDVGTFRWWSVVHVALVPVAAAIVLVWRRLRRRRP